MGAEAVIQPAKVQLTMEGLKELIASEFKAQIDALGLTKVDRKYAIFPTTDDMMGRTGPLTPEKAQKVVQFFKGLLHPEAARYMEVPGIAGSPLWRDLSIGSSGSGGYLVPTEFRAEVIIYLSKMPVMRNIVSVIPIGGKMDVPTVTGKPGLLWPGENTTGAGSAQPSFGQVPLSSKLGLALVPMSRQLFEHAGVDIVQLITKLFAEAFGLGEDAVICNGSGTGQPTGFRGNAAADGSVVTAVAQAGASLVGDDIIALYYAVPSQYRQNPKSAWLIPDSVTAKIRSLKDKQDRYLWADGFADAPARILGRPVLEQSNIPTNLGSGSPAVASEIWFGDWSFYYLGDAEQMGVETTTEGNGAFEKHQIQVKAFEEIDGQLAVSDAVRYLTGVK